MATLPRRQLGSGPGRGRSARVLALVLAGLALTALAAACTTAQAAEHTPPAQPTPIPPRAAKGTATPARDLPAIYLNTDRRALARGLATWTGRAPADYDLTVSYEARDERIGGTFKLTIRAGTYRGFAPVDVRARQWVDQADRKEIAARVADTVGIEALFERAAELYDYTGSRARGTATYDPIYGYPTNIQLQLVAEDQPEFLARVIQLVETATPARSLIADR